MTSDRMPTPRQRDRADRSRRLLEEREVPMWGDGTTSLYVDDDETAQVQKATDVACRALVLWAVALRADGLEWDAAKKILADWDLWDHLSAEEREYMNDANPAADVSQGLVWRLESLWVMLWALGRLPDLPWPSGMCDVPVLAEAMRVAEADSDFIGGAKLIPTADLLDAQDLTVKIHWAIRDAWIKGLCIPEDLDWRSDEGLPVQMCATVGVVEQRHHALNWILKFMDPGSWDEVDTPT